MANEHTCKYCKKSFSKESTLARHMCPKKKRFIDKDSVGSRIGFRVFQRFYELTTTATKQKTIEDFIESNYYLAFVKFGRHVADLNPIDFEKFITFVINSGIKLDDWTKDYVYDAYLIDLIHKEPSERAVERTITTMAQWAEENNRPYNVFFNEASVFELTFLIKTGRISPWVLYLAETAETVFNRFNSEQYKMIEPIIDTKIWAKKLTKNEDDCKFIKTILKEAQL